MHCQLVRQGTIFDNRYYDYTKTSIPAETHFTDIRMSELTREKARNWDRECHASWLRIYAIRLEPNVYVVTGGAIKLSRTMQEREHTALELDKLNRCKAFLKANGVFDQDSFVELTNEE